MSQIVDQLNEMLEAEKAGVETMAFFLEKDPTNELYKEVKNDEAWACAGLIQSVKREGGKISTGKGDFAYKVKALTTIEEQIELLVRGQTWVVRRIDRALDSPMSDETRAFLLEMREKHLVNNDKVEAYGANNA
ncbi:hypothetical protein BEP19_12115 [Ammoniphilus oxalaticus]|uniref:DUF6306 domain-containing protein n=1 Tax=Ammoniphilus oxalaticus TaxID=66863 RepID=A0A419SGR0_9BACL|nr:DUF6306 domain-containing protein [Ammoniphilus oxalaticus]RKD22969.1 hypothetical protein BEP19_12115 [Ammoniphilus oxalaticus]